MLRVLPRHCRSADRLFHLSSPSCSTQHQDHYKVLKIQTGATAKEIKAAYYKLSKKYHPDINPDDKEEAAKMFHQVAVAYEVLGSDEKRKLYDMTRIRTSPMAGPYTATGRRPAYPTKQYTDIDIDYKNFEQFQRSNRRRPQYHSHFEMPDEFYAEFGGGKKRVFKSEYEEVQEKHGGMYKDSRAAQREMEELRRQVEREQAEQQERYPIPTFERMVRDKRAKEAQEQRQYIGGLLVAAVIAGFSTLLLANK